LIQVWQSFHRPKKTTDETNQQVEGVSVVAVLKRADKKFYVLVKQWRIASRRWSIEFPAGSHIAKPLQKYPGFRDARPE